MTIEKNTHLIRRYIMDSYSSFSMGALGALAEFHQADDEAILRHDDNGLCRATARGAIRFDTGVVDKLKPIAYEILGSQPNRWSQGVAFCLPIEQARCSQRSVLTELGPDKNAILADRQNEILFDMGLSLLNCDFCIRTSDETLLHILRANIERPIFEPGNPALEAILSHHPHRIAVTQAGRVEVFQKIGGPDTGGKSPEGPHTHVLPKLIRTGRTHTANTPIPADLVPVATLYPENAGTDLLGQVKSFDVAVHNCFQDLLFTYGTDSVVSIKTRFKSALAEGISPNTFTGLPDGRYERAALRIAIRQQKRLAERKKDKVLLECLNEWSQQFDKTRVTAESV